MVGIRGGARRVAYVRGEGGDPLTSLLLLTTHGARRPRVLVPRTALGVSPENTTTTSKTRSSSGSSPRLGGVGTSGVALVELSCVWVSEVGHRADPLELVAPASGVRLVSEPGLG